MSFYPRIGLEIHVQVLTKSKMFCSCPNTFERSPNINVCPICLGHPGTLPSPNEEAVFKTVLLAKALNCRINSVSVPTRENYFYPDLPKGYQISQREYPIGSEGYLTFTVKGKEKRVRIQRVHPEEDTGKLLHIEDGTVIDFNRAGVPLIEIVTHPDLSEPIECSSFLYHLKEVLVRLNISEANMEEGNLRCEPNISVSDSPDKLGVRVELKNLGSFRAVRRGIEAEIKRQVELLKKGESVQQETRGFDERKNITYLMRMKEEAEDYRYFPDPDLKPYKITEKMVARAEEKLAKTVLPWQVWEELRAAVPHHTAEVLSLNLSLYEWYRKVMKHFSGSPKVVANFITGKFNHLMKNRGTPSIPPQTFGTLLKLVEERRLTKETMEEFIEENWENAVSEAEAESLATGVEMKEEELEERIKNALADLSDLVERYRKGEKKLFGPIVGEIMKRGEGRFDGKKVAEVLRRLL